MPTLVVTSGALAGERIELTGELIIGREHADLTIDDPEMSRRHAAIRLSDGGVELEDLGSTNGTLVDGVRISAPVMLSGGERVQLGETAIEIEIEAIDDGATRLHERPQAADLTMMRPTPTAPTPDATAAYTAPPPPPEPAPSAPPPQPAVTRAESRPPMPAPPVAAARAQPALPEQPFGAFTPTAGGRAGRRQGVATRLWVPAVLMFATIGGTAVALILYFAGR